MIINGNFYNPLHILAIAKMKKDKQYSHMMVLLPNDEKGTVYCDEESADKHIQDTQKELEELIGRSAAK